MRGSDAIASLYHSLHNSTRICKSAMGAMGATIACAFFYNYLIGKARNGASPKQ